MNNVIPRRDAMRLLRLRRDGNSLVIPLPRPLLRILHWKRGDFVAALVENDCLRVARIDLTQTFKQEDQ